MDFVLFSLFAIFLFAIRKTNDGDLMSVAHKFTRQNIGNGFLTADLIGF
jgi:hypothetical protein